MTVPDNDLIAEVLLASEGFTNSKSLAARLVSLFKLSKEGLSRQQHYDWGLRALKTCLGAAGKLLRQVCPPGCGSANSDLVLTLMPKEQGTLSGLRCAYIVHAQMLLLYVVPAASQRVAQRRCL